MNALAVISRLRLLQTRRSRARKLGVRFNRAADFTLPTRIQIGGELKDLRLPDDNGSKVAFIEILLDDCYGLRELPDDVQTVLDIGAHAGSFSLAARLRWPKATIHGYEPNPAMLPFLMQQSKTARFEVFNEAVAVADGRAVLHAGTDSVHARIKPDETGSICCAAFSAAVSRLGGAVDLVKLDCEGTEWDLLQDESSWYKVKHLTMEYHLWVGYSTEQLAHVIGDRGFEIQSLVASGEDYGLLRATRMKSKHPSR